MRVVILLGPPGSGKSAIGEVLRDRFGWRWEDRESLLFARWGDGFAEHKTEALDELHTEIRAEIRSLAADGGPTLVYESTGLSEAAFVDELVASGARVVRLDVSRATALERVAGRPQGRHLDDDPAVTAVVWDAFHDVVAPNRRVDLWLDTEGRSVASLAAAVARLVA